MYQESSPTNLHWRVGLIYGIALRWIFPQKPKHLAITFLRFHHWTNLFRQIDQRSSRRGCIRLNHTFFAARDHLTIEARSRLGMTRSSGISGTNASTCNTSHAHAPAAPYRTLGPPPALDKNRSLPHPGSSPRDHSFPRPARGAHAPSSPQAARPSRGRNLGRSSRRCRESLSLRPARPRSSRPVRGRAADRCRLRPTW